MVRTQIQLTDEQAARLRERAAAEGVPLAEIVRRGLEMYLANGGTVSMAERRRRALEAVGRFSGPGDLSERHDDYLEEAYGE
jgi:hypothetical protein